MPSCIWLFPDWLQLFAWFFLCFCPEQYWGFPHNACFLMLHKFKRLFFCYAHTRDAWRSRGFEVKRVAHNEIHLRLRDRLWFLVHTLVAAALLSQRLLTFYWTFLMQPTQTDNMLLSSQILGTPCGSQGAMQRLVKRMTRFWTSRSARDTLDELCTACKKLKWVFKAFRVWIFACVVTRLYNTQMSTVFRHTAGTVLPFCAAIWELINRLFLYFANVHSGFSCPNGSPAACSPYWAHIFWTFCRSRPIWYKLQAVDPFQTITNFWPLCFVTIERRNL